METSLRIILLLVGIFIIAGIIWDTLRARRSAKDREAAKAKQQGRVVRIEMESEKQSCLAEELAGSDPNAQPLAGSDPNVQNAQLELDNLEIETVIIKATPMQSSSKSPLLHRQTMEDDEEALEKANVINDEQYEFAEDLYQKIELPVIELQEGELTAVQESFTDKLGDEFVGKAVSTKTFASASPSSGALSSAAKPASSINSANSPDYAAKYKSTSPLTSNSSSNTNGDFKQNAFYHSGPIILSVMARNPGVFSKRKLLEAFREANLYYGEMQIYHYHEHLDGTGDIVFSVTSAVEPGILNISDLDFYTTPGLTLFFLPSRPNLSIASFESMLRVAKLLAMRLDGELRDDERRILTLQRIDKYRDRVRMLGYKYAAV